MNMKLTKKALFAGVVGLSSVLSVMPRAYADDTEIFFTNQTTEAVKPNVLLVLDTSGSMTGRNSYDGTGQYRIDRMKDALTELITGANNVNIGLMRFVPYGGGGTVLYPVRDIDGMGTGIVTIGDTVAYIGDGNDDAVESTVSKVMKIDEKTLALTGTPGLIDQAISQKSDDARELNGTTKVSQNSLKLSSGAVIGLRFNNLKIPADAKITKSEIQLVSSSKQRKAVFEFDIRVETATSTTFTSAGGIKGRDKSTLKVDWDHAKATISNGQGMQTPSLNKLIQERVSHKDWKPSGDDLTFFITRQSATKDVSFHSRDSSSTNAPRLYIEYTSSAGSASQTVGLRFENVEIPQGATIKSAVIEFTSSDSQELLDDNDGTAGFRIKGERSGDAAEFTTDIGNISSRTFTSKSVNWLPVPRWTQTGEVYTSPNIASIIGEITGTGNTTWCGGNHLALFLSSAGGNLGSRIAQAYEESPDNAPRLKITYDPDTIPSSAGCLVRTFTSRVSELADDAEQQANNNMLLSSPDLELVDDADGSTQKVGLRFQNINIPAGADITEAYLSFHASVDSAAATSLDIVGNRAATAKIFTDSPRNISARSTTAARTSWSNVSPWLSDTAYQSPDISAIVDEIININGWKPGNDLAFMITGSGSRIAHSFDGNPGLAPRLVIKAKTYGQPAITNKSVRQELIDSVNNDMHASGNTPVVDALYEGMLYYRGEYVTYGKNRGSYTSNYDARRYGRVSHAESYVNGTHKYPSGCSAANLDDSDCKLESISGSPKYVSPIIDECQQTNHLVLLTDGDPTALKSHTLSSVKSKISPNTCTKPTTSTNAGKYGLCGQEFTDWMYAEDQMPALDGEQVIKTYAIGFGNSDVDEDWLKSLASDSDAPDPLNNGADGYYTATSSQALLDAFEDILEKSLKIDTTFVTPGITVNNFNQLNHRGELYYALFKPDTHPRWDGNLKRYELENTGYILDATGQQAIDPTTGFFKSTAKSWWSSTVDGSEVAAGGAASKLPSPSARRVLTTAAGSTKLVELSTATVSQGRLGINQSSAYHQKLINWARGADVDDEDGDGNVSESLGRLADPLHSTPILATYGGTDANPDVTVFYGDNEGFLHAINASSGEEYFAFIPDALLPNLDAKFVNSETSPHKYGLDGEVNLDVFDKDKDNQIEKGDGDYVYVYTGMRRGGRNYYALDATTRTAPKLLWQIQAGTTGFEELGQTWSKPVSTRIKMGKNVIDVLIFAGGYDPQQDNATVRTADTQGRAIYIVNSETGALIWSGAGNGAVGSGYDKRFTDMKYSIPSNIRAFDPNGDGVADQLYVGDMGGQVWRFDINNGVNQASKLVSGGVIGDFGGDNKLSNRRFYYAPDISVVTKGPNRYLSIAIGSGWRAHPLDKAVDDRIYVMKNLDVTSPPDDANNDGEPDYIKLTEGVDNLSLSANQLFDATDNIIGQGSEAERLLAQKNLQAASGWFLRLDNDGYRDTHGEKVMSSPITFGGQMYFTTYEPTPNTQGCQVNPGVARLYHIFKEDARPVVNYDGVGGDDVDSLTRPDRVVELMTPVIPPPPQRLRIDGKDVICVGTECVAKPPSELFNKTYWMEE